MKKFLLSSTVIALFLGYIASQKITFGDDHRVVAPQSLSMAVPSTGAIEDNSSQATAPSPVYTPPAQTAKPVSTTPPTPKPVPAPKPKGQYNDGTYTGPSVDAYYGYVQVQAVISGGKLVGVKFLDYPHDRSTSREINSQAMPYLISEAIQAQSANVDTVSGASDTSAAFIQSLRSALSQAKA